VSNKNLEDKKSRKNALPEIVAAAVLNKKVRKTTVALFAAKVVADEIVYNRQHYYEMLAFNFNNGIKSNKVYDKIHFSDLPEEYREQVSRLYSVFAKQTTVEIFDALGIVQTIKNRSSPIEAKFAYEYYKKYKTFDYDPILNRTLSDSEILGKLKKSEISAYLRWF
jgi:hypothetical protein